MNAFWALVRNDIGLPFRGLRRKSKYFWLYVAAAAVIWLIQYALTLASSDRFAIDPRYAALAVTPLFAILSGLPVRKEWRGDTTGWWLSLPYPRARLLMAKAAASLIQKLGLILVMLAALALLFAVLVILRPDLATPEAASTYKTQSLQTLALLLLFCPGAVAWGLVNRIMGLSRWRVATPLFWLGMPVAFCYLVVPFVGSGSASIMDTICGIWSRGAANFLLFLLAEAAFTAILMLFSAYLLNRQVEL